ncbi:MAG: SDR family oxidoreductase [Burkholderiales bacterium]
MFKPDLLAGRVAFITGGGTGLGKAIATHYVRHGAKVVLVGRREAVLRDTAETLAGGMDCTLAIGCDVRFQDEVENAIDLAVAHFGKIDILVNNAAGNFVFPTKLLSSNAFKLIIDTVLMGAVNCTLALGKRWIAGGQPGSVLNILTTYASTGSAFVVPSSCAKAGVENLTKSLAAEWGRYGIRCVGIAPGPFPTDGAMQQLRLHEDLLPGVDLKQFATRRIPLGRLGRVEELADLATFLVSPNAEFINGEIIRIDGGEIPNLSGEFCFLNDVDDSKWEGHASRLKRE